MDKDTKESLKKATELQMKCGCEDPPTFNADRDGWRQAKSHQEKHAPNGASIRFIYPD